MDRAKVRARAARIVADDWGPKQARRLVVRGLRTVRVVRVEEVLAPDQRAAGRVARSAFFADGGNEVPHNALERVTLRPVEQVLGYREAADARPREALPPKLAERVEQTVGEWERESPAGQMGNIRVGYAEEPIARCAVRLGSEVLYVGLGSGRVLSREQRSLGASRAALSIAAFGVALSFPAIGWYVAGVEGLITGGVATVVALMAGYSFTGGKKAGGWV